MKLKNTFELLQYLDSIDIEIKELLSKNERFTSYKLTQGVGWFIEVVYLPQFEYLKLKHKNKKFIYDSDEVMSKTLYDNGDDEFLIEINYQTLNQLTQVRLIAIN